ncbi:MAG: CmcI family methyltransferase [Acidobacteriota bacterium]
MALEDHLDMTLREWIQHFQDQVVQTELNYRGVTILKNVMDLWVYQELIHLIRPEVVIEIGSKHGGSALWFADTLSWIGGEVLSIDLKSPSLEAAGAVKPKNLTFLEGDSVAPETVDAVRTWCRGRRAMVVADGDHSAGHVLRELEIYAEWVPAGGYFIVEDGIVDVMRWEQFCPGPVEGVRRFLETRDDFEVDRECEKMILTYNPGCFLRRIR